MDANATLLDRLLDPMFAGETARRVLDFEIDAASRARLDFLRAAANEGRLTPAERAEYERFVDRLDLISTLKAEARAALTRRLS